VQLLPSKFVLWLFNAIQLFFAKSNNKSVKMATDGYAWRQMTADDISDVVRIADQVHASLPESDGVFAERAKLFPQGCLILVDKDNRAYGYTISHPIREGQPPELDSLLGEIAPTADQYYIHDVAILPELRGRGLAAEAIRRLVNVGKQFSTTCLVSVYGTAPFWARFGFQAPEDLDEALQDKLRGYGDDATYMVRSNAEGAAPINSKLGLCLDKQTTKTVF